jgi:hypothetical protein
VKPGQLRARRKAVEAVKAGADEVRAAFLADGVNPLDRVDVGQIPTEMDYERGVRELSALARQAERQPRGAARNRKVDQMLPIAARLVVIGRVLEMERLERAALTPRKLQAMAAQVTPDDMRALVARLAS